MVKNLNTLVSEKVTASIPHWQNLYEKWGAALPPPRAFTFPYLKSHEDVRVILSRLDPQTHNCVKGSVACHLSKKHRINLSRAFDAYHAFHCLTLPDEKITKATLYTRVICPKNPVLKQQWIDDTLDDNEWQFHEEDVEKHYVPLKTVYNIQGPFTFFDNPLNVLYPYSNLSVEITFDHPTTLTHRCILIETYTWTSAVRKAIVEKTY
jgi:hypothetical protein